MVYLGLGILVASLSFLVYKNRSLSFSDLVTPWRRKNGIKGQTRDEQQTGNDIYQKERKSGRDVSNTLVSAQNDGLRDGTDEEEGGSQQTTPKATPITTSKSTPIPSFTLNDEDSPATLTGSPATSSATPASQSRNIPTTRNPDRTRNQSSMPPPPRPPIPNPNPPPQPLPPLPMPPPPRPSPKSTPHRPPPSSLSTLRAPPTTTLHAPTSSTLPPRLRPPPRPLLAPSHSPLDWAHLVAHPPTATFFRGAALPAHLIRVPPSLLRQHNGRGGRDAWATWRGGVYNVTPYLGFHPGGEKELMRGVGREGVAERLFLEVHSWVSWEGLLGECLVGVMVGEGEREGEGGLEEMD